MNFDEIKTGAVVALNREIPVGLAGNIPRETKGTVIKITGSSLRSDHRRKEVTVAFEIGDGNTMEAVCDPADLETA